MLPFLDHSEALHRVIYTNYTLLGTLMVYWMSILLLIFDNVWNYASSNVQTKTCWARFYLRFQPSVTLKILKLKLIILIPPILIIPTLKDVLYSTYYVNNLRLSFYSFFFHLLTLLFFRLPKLPFWTLFRAKHIYLFLASPYSQVNYLLGISRLLNVNCNKDLYDFFYCSSRIFWSI